MIAIKNNKEKRRCPSQHTAWLFISAAKHLVPFDPSFPPAQVGQQSLYKCQQHHHHTTLFSVFCLNCGNRSEMGSAITQHISIFIVRRSTRVCGTAQQQKECLKFVGKMETLHTPSCACLNSQIYWKNKKERVSRSG